MTFWGFMCGAFTVVLIPILLGLVGGLLLACERYEAAGRRFSMFRWEDSCIRHERDFCRTCKTWDCEEHPAVPLEPCAS